MERYQLETEKGIRDVDKTRGKSNADVLDIGESILKFASYYMNNCYNFHHMGRNKLSVSFRTYHDANSFVDVISE